jgi:hypothetical protein
MRISIFAVLVSRVKDFGAKVFVGHASDIGTD